MLVRLDTRKSGSIIWPRYHAQCHFVVYNGTLAYTSSSWQGALDDREDPDSRVVVNLRRKQDPDEAERERLASTIFAPEEETATFSMGNLVAPRKRSADEAVDDSTQADPFIDT